MGNCFSSGSSVEKVISTRNDYELVIKASKELEHLLESRLGATGKGLHEKATSVEHHLSRDLCKRIHYLATIRNKLVHEYDFNSIPDRAGFIRSFVQSEKDLQIILKKIGRTGSGSKGDICAMQ